MTVALGGARHARARGAPRSAVLRRLQDEEPARAIELVDRVDLVAATAQIICRRDGGPQSMDVPGAAVWNPTKSGRDR